MGQTAWSEQMVQRVFMEAESRDVPVIMDADALNLLAKLRLSNKLPNQLILTPHPGFSGICTFPSTAINSGSYILYCHG